MTEQRAFPTPIEILTTDPAASTARAIVVGWHITKPVTLSLAMLVEATGLTAAQLPGRWLEATVNCHAYAAGDLVLQDITVAPDHVAEWTVETR